MIKIGDVSSLTQNWTKEAKENKITSEYFINYEHITQNFKLIKHKISSFGFCIINRFTTAEETKDFICELDANLGKRMRQSNINDDKEFLVMPRKGISTLISRDEGQPLHTDYAYNAYEPTYVILQCIKSAEIGGYSLILQTSVLDNYLKNKYGDLINLLYEDNAFTYIRGFSGISKPFFKKNSKEQIIASCSIFSQIIKGKTKEHEIIFNDIIKYTTNLDNLIRYKLKENEILIMRNGLVLHGRTGFEGERILKRIWYSEND